jgi:hypothetical protein
MKQRSRLDVVNAILNALYCEKISDIVRESGFNSYQAMSQWLERNNYKLVRRYELIKKEEKQHVKK